MTSGELQCKWHRAVASTDRSWPDSARVPSGCLSFKPLSVPPSRERRRPQCQGIERYSPVLRGRAATVSHAGSLCAGKSATLSFDALNASRKLYRRARSTVSNDGQGGRIGALKDGLSRECGLGTDSRSTTVPLLESTQWRSRGSVR